MNASTPNKTKSELHTYIDYLSCSQDPVTNSETSNTEFSQIVCLFKSGKRAFLPKHYETHKNQSQGHWKGLADTY